MSKDVQTRFHEDWLGLAQPYEGLVFSVPVLADAQIMPDVGADLTARFKAALVFDGGEDAPGHIADLRAFFERFLGYHRPGRLVARTALPAELSFYAHEGRQELRPSFAIARGPFESGAMAELFGAPGSDGETTTTSATKSPWVALVWDVREDAGAAGLGLSLDKAEEQTGSWRYPPTAKFERLLRHTGIPVGFVCNGPELRLVYAPAGESTSHLTFRVADMQQPGGRPLLAAFELLLSAQRTYQAGEAFTFEGLLRESRRRQADVTKDLAEQVFEAVELLLEGFEQAAARDASDGRLDWLRAALEAGDDHLYQGVVSVVLRLVFLLYAEDQGLLPMGHETYARHLSVQGLYDDLVDDAGMHPESMHHRYGAYGRLLALFRAMFLGVLHGDLRLPPRRGKLFDPSTYPFLEGGSPESTAAIVSPEARAQVHPPSLDDATVHALLHRLIVFEGQRLSYRALDVEQIGSIYESLMGYHVLRVETPAVRLGTNRVWVETGALRSQKAAERAKWLKEVCGLSPAQIGKVDSALKQHASDTALAEALNELSPGKKHDKSRHRVPAAKLVLQPGEERRRSGSHYTPRSLTERIVRRTLEPLLKCLGDAPNEAQILSLKICDPAMGSGAFLVEVTRQLADQLVSVWTREGKLAAMAEECGDPHLHARRLVAQRCVYGVDKNPAAVELAKLSLWLITLSSELPFTFVDHSLRHGDSLVGLNIEQITSFHWQPTKQVPLFKQVLEESLEEALEHRGALLALATSEDARSQEEKRRLLDHAEHATERVRLVADLCVGAFFAEAKDKAREVERERRKALVERWLAGDESVEPELRGLAAEIRERHAPLHWWLEFPEVFYQARPDPLCGGEVNGAAYMEGFVGNPPFAGKNTTAAAAGPNYSAWLKSLHVESHGNADIAAHFFRRSCTLLGGHGAVSLLATKTIGQGDTGRTGLAFLVKNGWTIYDAETHLRWAGDADIFVSKVALVLGEPTRKCEEFRLDNVRVFAINSRLEPITERPLAAALQANVGTAYVGSYVLGMGFTLTPAERDALVAANVRNAERIFPYLGGQELNTSPTQRFERFVISFGDVTLERAEAWSELIAVVREKVKPERERLKDNPDGKRRKAHWWQFGRDTPALYAALAPLKRCLVTARVTKHLCFSFCPIQWIYNEKTYVFSLDGCSAFGVLQSRIHEAWTRLLSSDFGSSSIGAVLNYSASDCFDTFPFPQPDPRAVIPTVEAAGEALYTARAHFMVETNQGLTKTYNALKDAKNGDERVLELRRLHEAMDRAVLDAYGWGDLNVPPYCPSGDAEKAQLAAFEDEIIDRLYVLNAERAREEARLGLGKTKGKGKTKSGKGKKGAEGTATLLGMGEDGEGDG